MMTKKQKTVLDFIRKFKTKNGYSPALQEIKKHLGLSSVSTAHHHVKKLKEKGYLNREENQPRAINIYESEPLMQINLLGNIAAGKPIEALEEKESIAIPKSMLPKNGDFFALRIKGESMIEENIDNDDIVIIRKQENAANGDKVVALIDNEEATLKKFYQEKNKIRLRPANKKMEDMIFDANQVQIQGVMVNIIKT